MISQDIIDIFRVPPGKRFKLKNHDPGWAGTEEMQELSEDTLKAKAKEILDDHLRELCESQELLYADNRYSILIVLQAMDAAGKDGTIKHVMSGINPQGCQVFSFKKPTLQEYDHTFLWRYMCCLPERGRIGIFNRSYYEDVLVAKVHPEALGTQLPISKINKKFWKKRYEDIVAFEEHLVRNGTIVVKFFLNVSKEEQKKRFLKRLDEPDKNWKFSAGDITERGYWDAYMEAYQDALQATSTKAAPWYVIPADRKWVTRTLVSDILSAAVNRLDLRTPKLTPEQLGQLVEARQKLLNE
jgi:PPK2 family polyphosphate:nucleotide phosphotransferase